MLSKYYIFLYIQSRSSKINPVIESVEEIQLSINKLKFLIEKHYIEKKVPIESIDYHI